MNHGGVQSSPVQQMVAAGSPTWWSINNIRPPLHHHHHHHNPFLAAPPPHHFPPHQFPPPPSSWNIDDDLPTPDSWSQLLLGGLVGEDDDKPGSNHIRKMENWEQQQQQFLNNQIPNAIKHENDHMSSRSSSYNNYRSPGNVELFQGAKPSTNNCWSHQQLMVSASSPKSCVTTTNLSNNLLDFSPQSECNSTATGGAAAKKARITQPVSSAQSTFKVRKEKLGDRVTALHQLVSPFGKTDTASVLLEAIGYIKFLQNQIEALTQPYLGSGSSANMIRQQHPPIQGERNSLFPEDPGQLVNENCMKRKGISDLDECDDQEPKQDLKSRGLCLVPISCTLDVGSEINGADYWAPSFAAANFR